MDAATNTGVDYIRDLRENVMFTPAMLKKRVYIIDEAHMLSDSAFNPHGGPGEAGAAVIGTAPTGK